MSAFWTGQLLSDRLADAYPNGYRNDRDGRWPLVLGRRVENRGGLLAGVLRRPSLPAVCNLDGRP